MRLVLGLGAFVVIAVACGFAFWPGLITSIEEFSFLVAADVFNFQTAFELVTPALTYIAIAAATVTVVVVGVRGLTGDR